jgi:hypothetical protein
MRYCPPYVAPNKAGRPKEGKRKRLFGGEEAQEEEGFGKGSN